MCRPATCECRFYSSPFEGSAAKRTAVTAAGGLGSRIQGLAHFLRGCDARKRLLQERRSLLDAPSRRKPCHPNAGTRKPTHSYGRADGPRVSITARGGAMRTTISAAAAL